MNNKNNLLFSGILVLFLFGCGGNPVKPELPQSTTVRNQLVMITLPDDFFVIPDNIPSLDTATATQREVATWVVENEKRTNTLENKILELRQYFVNVYDLLKKNSENVIVIDVTKSEENNSKIIKDANDKPIIVPAPVVTEGDKKDESLFERITGFFKSKPIPEPTPEPTVVKPTN